MKNNTENQPIKLRPNYECRGVFTNDEENIIVEYILGCSQMNYGLTRFRIRQLAFEVAMKNGKGVPDNWHTSKMAGIDWLSGFMTRHRELSLRKPFDKHNVSAFFDKLQEMYSRFSSFADGTRVYNLDETATSTVQKPTFVGALKGSKQVAQISSAERGILVTTCCIVNSLGQSLPPVMVFPRKHFKEMMLFGAPTGTLGLANPSGWMTRDLFLRVMKHFVKFTNASKENPVLLILDNHESHLSIEVIDYAKENGITILTLHPHCSHKMQPLDVAVYGPFKSYYAGAMNARLQQKPGVPITIYDVAALVGEAHKKAMIPSNIISGFKRTGIFPFNRDVFQEYEFSPSLVTDRPFVENQEASNASISPENSENIENEPTDTTLGNRTEGETAASSLVSDVSDQTPDRPICVENGFVSPQRYLGYPKAGKRKNKTPNRKKLTSMIVTDTPQKELLMSQRSKPKIKPKGTKSRRLQYNDSSDSCQEMDQHLSDHSSDNYLNDECTEGECLTVFPTRVEPPKVNDYVLVEFDTEPKTYFVGLVTKPKDDEDDYEVSYMRKKRSVWEFNFPTIADIASVKMADIKVVLPHPNQCGTTSRQKSSYAFTFDFHCLNVH